MEKRTFYTTVRSDHTLIGDDDVFGPIMYNEDGWVFTAVCTEEEYRAFADIVNKIYPCLCVFDQSIVRKEES